MPITLNPMDGCDQCKWHEHRGERILDQDGICDLHKAIADLQESLAIERDVRRSMENLVSEVCEIIGAGDDDDPAVVARTRMDEIKMLEDLACINCGERPKSGDGSRTPHYCVECAAQL